MCERFSWKFRLLLLLLTLIMLSANAVADVSLPRPVDVPPGPEGVPGPGGALLPPLAEEAPAVAPAISAISDVTFPDETLAIAGFGLSGAHLRIWREGGTEDLAPLRTAHDRMLAVVPRDWPVSAMLVWPVRDGQVGAPIRVNGATAWWAWPPRIAANADGRLSSSPGPPTLLLMGKNLKLDGAEPQVYLSGPGGPRQLTVVAARAYQLTVQLPDALRHGVYEVFAHNGTGGPFGWSGPVRVEVVPAPAASTAKFDVAAFGAVPDDGNDDAPAIQRAVDAAAEAGGGTIQFAPGVYHLIQVPNGKRVIIRECDFAGADRRGGKMMNRSISVYNTPTRDLFIADNHSHDVGMVCSRDDRLVNQGEQILFHFRYPHGGYFDVLEAGPADMTIDPADPRNTGNMPGPHTAFDRAAGRVLDEMGENDHWIVFVSSGKGAGQYRVVAGMDRRPEGTVLAVDRPWRVVPDRTSRVTLTTAFRRNIILGNTIDAGFIDPRRQAW